MKKNGYTLAEVLVTLGVIGLVAAITGPLITKFTPDAEKIAYLKTYDMLSKTINEIARNQTFYPPIYEDEITGNLVNFTNAPLLNLSAIEIGDKTIDGYNKIAKLFGYYTGLKKLEEVDNIDSTYQSEYKNNPDFITKDGAAILMTTNVDDLSDTEMKYQTDVYVDINGTDKGKNCFYSTTCAKPDIFKFAITAAGEVIPADEMGNGYLETRHSWKASKGIAKELTLPKTTVDVSELVLIKGNKSDEGVGDNYTFELPWKPTPIPITPRPTPIPDTDNSSSTSTGSGGGGIDEDQNASDPCNFCAPPWTECRRGVCVNPYDHERNKTKTEASQDWLDSLDSPQNLRQNTGSSSVPLY